MRRYADLRDPRGARLSNLTLHGNK